MSAPLSPEAKAAQGRASHFLRMGGAIFLAGVVLGLASLFHVLSDAERTAAFSKVEDSNPPLSLAQVEQLMGQPARMEQSASLDQAVTGEVYHYPYRDSDMKVVFVNGTVFKAELVSGNKS